MLSRLVDIQYERNDVTFEPGKFRVRGDCVELWPSYEEFAFRIEFWGDEVEQLSIINPITRRGDGGPAADVHLSGQAFRHAAGPRGPGRGGDPSKSWSCG